MIKDPLQQPPLGTNPISLGIYIWIILFSLWGFLCIHTIYIKHSIMAFLQHPLVAPMPLLLLLQSIVFKIIIIISFLRQLVMAIFTHICSYSLVHEKPTSVHCIKGKWFSHTQKPSNASSFSNEDKAIRDPPLKMLDFWLSYFCCCY